MAARYSCGPTIGDRDHHHERVDRSLEAEGRTEQEGGQTEGERDGEDAIFAGNHTFMWLR
ncbi:hypothetical protein ACERIM_16205 [Natrinema sp. H-ect1]|uniref:hypothetical protein n=1 Tax=Natrinema sp. H-ect1 TaxID=3242700 RepID=UPI00359D9FFB